ncbi:MAG: hypothetical protein HFJ60_00755 [Clostridia bacterium]|jgi:hypothetical protein|nr:hypothetical protein [Clostridia bacterium]
MKVKKKILLSIIGISTICLILNPIKSKAALQANGNGNSTATVNDWLINIRKIEAIGGTLGLAAGINGNLTDSGETNNIDVHMQKNTEYGAMAILSASAYGNQKKIADGETTTGNKSGIYIALNKEWVSAGLNDLSSTNFKNALGKYKNIYTATYVAKVGDAITETNGWHGSGASRWINNSNTGVIRAYSGSLFSYFAGAGDTSGIALNNRVYSSRAVIVVGNGF